MGPAARRRLDDASEELEGGSTTEELNLSLEEMRRQYRQGGLSKAALDPSPFVQFEKWFADAKQAELPSWWEINAMTLSTGNRAGQVTSRTVLLKGIDDQGFVFFTNYESEKGRQLSENNQAALLFFWPHLERQVRVRGEVSKVSRSESQTYFHSRPRGSQIGAAASFQSQPIADRSALEQEFARHESALAGQDVPLPKVWGGYRLSPVRFEFWQGRENRLHDRLEYELTDRWNVRRLQP